MNVQAPLDNRAYDSRMWWVMVAGCAARFSAERSAMQAWSGFLLWIVIFAACWFVRARLSDSARSHRSQQAGNVVAIVGLLLFLLELNSEGLVPALLVFLFAIQGAVFIAATKRLHAWLIVGAALGGVLFAAAESRSSSFLVCAVWFTFAALGLLALDHRHDRERAMVLQPAGVASKRTGGVLFATIALLCTLPLYLFVPKPPGMLLGGMQATAAHDYRSNSDDADSDRQSRSDGDDDVPQQDDRSEGQPDESSRTRESSEPARPQEGDYGDNFSIDDVQRSGSLANTVVMYVKSSRPINLRGPVYDRFASNRWHRDPQTFDDYTLERGNLEVRMPPAGDDSVRQSIEIVRDMGTTLVHAPGVRRLRFPGPTVRRYADDVFVVPQPLRAPTTYSVESRLGLSGGRYSLALGSPRDPERYLETADVSARVRALAEDVTAGQGTARERALALEAFLRTEYRYSYETIARQGYTPLDWFLFEGKQGHCEYFASALAMLLRVVGIPSRVATGFSLTAPNPVTGYYEVRALDGHAWVEAFIDGQWLMLEPTPFYPLPLERADGQVADQLDSYLDRLALTNAVLEPDAVKTRVVQVASRVWRQTRQALRSVANVPRELGWLLPASLVLGALGCALMYVAIMATMDWLANRNVRTTLARAANSNPQHAAVVGAHALQDTTAPRGLARREAASFREYLAMLQEAGCVVPKAFADEFDSARYGTGELATSSESMRGLRELIESLLRADPWPRVRRTVESWRRWFAERLRSD
jgi:hypothetical protein